MTALLPDTSSETGNPLDVVEQIAHANDWSYNRHSEDELGAELTGQWCQYRLWFCWHSEMSVMHLSCALDVKVPAKKREAIYGLLAMANEKLWLGHFDYWPDDKMIVFRHGLLLRDGFGIGPELLEELVDIEITECERFYPAFQLLIWGGKKPADALAAAMLDTEGEA